MDDKSRQVITIQCYYSDNKRMIFIAYILPYHYSNMNQSLRESHVWYGRWNTLCNVTKNTTTVNALQGRQEDYKIKDGKLILVWHYALRNTQVIQGVCSYWKEYSVELLKSNHHMCVYLIMYSENHHRLWLSNHLKNHY